MSKILFVIPSLAKGGQEKAGMVLTNYLREYHDVTVVCFEEKNPDDFDYKSEVIRIISPLAGGFMKKPVNGIHKIILLKKLKKKINPDVSIAFGNSAIIWNWLTDCGEKKISSVRQSFTGILKNNSRAVKIHKSLYIRALKNSEKITTVSSKINDELKQYFNIKTDIFINNGYDIDLINKMASEDEPIFKDNRLYFIHSGRFDISKGHWHLIKIFTEIKKSLSEAKLLLLGGTDDSTPQGALILNYCKYYCDKNNLKWSDDENADADVIFLGHKKNPFKYISGSHLFIFTSLWEGFPNALVEAMACGVPVVAANCATGPKEILINNETGEKYGLLLPAFDQSFNASLYEPEEADLYAATQIISLLKNPEQINYFKQKSIERAKHYSVDEMGKQWLKLVKNKDRQH